MLLARERKDDLGAVNVRFDRTDWRLDDQLNAYCCSKVVDHVCFIDKLCRDLHVVAAVDRVLEIRVLAKVTEVLD